MRFVRGVQVWTRLICLAFVTALLVVATTVLFEVDGWLTYETGWQIAGEIGARVTLAMLVGGVLSTLAALLALPYLLQGDAESVSRRCDRIVRLATLLVLVVCGVVILGTCVLWFAAIGLVPVTNLQAVRSWALLASLFVLAITLHYLRAQPSSWSNLSASLTGRQMRRLLVLAGVTGLVTGGSAALRSGSSQGVRRAVRRTDRSPNILLVTFDALSAEDMSCYGYGLPTTPNIDRLARTSYRLSNYYAASTFTTSCVATMLTGSYPSQHKVYHYGGYMRGAASGWSVARLLRDRGYATAASVANPGAHPRCLGLADDFDILPSPPVTDFASRDVATFFGSAQLAAEIGRGSHLLPYMLEQLSSPVFGQLHSTFPPLRSFQQARQILAQLPRPFFLWVHVFAPHFPYLPEPPYLHTFLPTDELRTHAEFADMLDRSGASYSPAKQVLIDKGRLRYNEWLAQADAAFGDFIAQLTVAGHLANTALMVSADHGESFQGGLLGHGGPRQLRPVLHAPLLVQLPGQQVGYEVAATADQTLLAPTILELAGVHKRPWMAGGSLQSLQRSAAGSVPGRAFTQYLEHNSVFRPIVNGTVGVIDGQRQYVLDIASGRGSLFDLAEAHEQRIDLATVEPAVAAELRGAICRQFPEVMAGPHGTA